jgi:hypothetical protein
MSNPTKSSSSSASAQDRAYGVTVTPLQDSLLTSENNSLVTGQPGGAAIFSVVLDTQPSADVTITFTSSDQTEGRPVNPVLTFTHDNWNIPQTLTVHGVDDLDYDGDVAYIVSGSVSGDSLMWANR